MSKISVKIAWFNAIHGGVACSVAVVAALLVALWSCAGSSTPAEMTEAQKNARARNSQGVVAMDQHNYARGRAEFAAVVDLDPKFATGFANLGIAYYSLGKYDSAQAALQTCLELSLDHLNANYTLGLIYHAQGQEYGLALRAFERVAAVDPNDPLVHYYLGRTHSKLGNSEQAEAELRRAIALDPSGVSAYYALAQEMRSQKRMKEWRQILEQFNELTQSGLEGVSASYQGQGKYAEVSAPVGVGPQRVDRGGDLTFTVVNHNWATLPPAALVDADGDGGLEILTAAGELLSVNDQGLAISDAWQLSGMTGDAAPLVADLDLDGDADLAVPGEMLIARIQKGEGSGTFSDALRIGAAASGAVLSDIDHDGDADLLAFGDATQLLSNDGRAGFSEIAAAALQSTPLRSSSGEFSDFDNDRDIDFLTHTSQSLSLWSNNRDGTFSDVAAQRSLPTSGAAAVAVGDLIPDGYSDIALFEASGSGMLQTQLPGHRFEARPLPAVSAEVRGSQAADLDNDGDLDLVVYGTTGTNLLVAHNGDYRVAGALEGSESLFAVDADADGRLDLLMDGRLQLNRSNAGSAWISIVPSGLNSNPDGIGVKVEVKTSEGTQKRELGGGPEDSPYLHFGLGNEQSVEFVRLLWPSGVRQTESDTVAGLRLHVKELNRKGTSCPILFAWDGEGFRFVSDFLGGAIIGYLTGPGQYYLPDTDEYLPLGTIAPHDGHYELRIANALEEIIYLDGAELVAVDHPAGTRLLANERLLSSPPYPEFAPVPLSKVAPLAGAWDSDGQDVRHQLAKVDDDWYDGFERLDIHGYTREHNLVLDLGDLRHWQHPVLLAHGWVDYAHSTSNWAASQRLDVGMEPPRLEVADGDRWRLVTEDMGRPAGLPKYMVYDLKEAFPQESADFRLRITTSAAIYWDQFQVGEMLEPAETTIVHRRSFEVADLHWRGFPTHVAIKGTSAFRYNYDQLHTDAGWGTHAGGFTRLGPVEELVAEVDDRYVIMFHGDELILKAAADDFPSVPKGMERSFLFYADGFGKDMDLHSAHSLTVGPLPFHRMSQYPYPTDEHYPTDEEHVNYALNYNTRFMEGDYR
ncbi:MAG: FG-GAP-like repeat-containing protein [Candidatus Latescibacterota bacterium]|nr:FG-GAP-like repeat-containing protein [Candidatus Latescibacterota bacterium]